MSRSRNIKPGFFKNEVLGDMEPIYRLLFIGLWTYADREGRFELRPRRIKADILPYDDINIEDGIASLAESGFLFVYAGEDGREFVQIANWGKHQNPHHKEVGSSIPAPNGHQDKVCQGYIPLSNTIRRRIYQRDGRVCKKCGATHGLSIDHIVPVSKGGNSTDDNLQVLCLGCNVRKSNNLDASFMHESCIDHASTKEDAPCPTDSLIPDSLNLIPDSLEKPSERQAARFDEFWSVYPNKKGKQDAAKKWKSRKLDTIADRIIADVQARKLRDKDWLRGYVPHGSTYINGSGWEDDIPDIRPQASDSPMSKTMQGIQILEEMKNGLAPNRTDNGISEAPLLELGPSARR